MVKKSNNACLNNNDNPSAFDSIEDYGGIYADRLMKDNIMGVGIYSCPDFQLIKANQKYLSFIQSNNKKENDNTRFIISNSIEGSQEINLESLFMNIMKTKETIYLEEIESISNDDEIHYLNGHLTPIVKDGNINKIICALYETTEQILRMKQAELKNEELREATELQDEFLLMITHELKTPLLVIATTIQAIELRCQPELSNIMIKYLNKIRQNTYRQLKLVNDILDNTRMNSGLFRLNIIRVDIIQLSRTIIESISTIAESKRIKISFHSAVKRLVIETDINLYERILLKLLCNAVKYTPPGKSVEVKIYQMEANGSKEVCIQVKDSGIGIPIDKKELIFERFTRVDKFDNRFAGGTGIGLYLVKMLVSMIDGEIKLESKEGIGSIFTLILPVKDTNINMSIMDTVIMENVNER
jgi:signal transduction histidine kinase